LSAAFPVYSLFTPPNIYLADVHMSQTFVTIIAEHDTNGIIKSTILHWADGRQFEVDKIMDVHQAPSLIGGGHGMRYICRIRNKEVNLFHDDMDGKWFVGALNKPSACAGNFFVLKIVLNR